MTPEERRARNRESSRAWRQRNAERVRAERRDYQRDWRQRPENREKQRAYLQSYGPQKRLEQKLAVLNAYGGAACACCGESEIAFLSIDHIDGGGNEHRRQLRPGATAKSSGGATMYRWLIKEGFPSGFQVLCFNCNHGKHINGGVCPHQETTLRLIRESA